MTTDWWTRAVLLQVVSSLNAVLTPMLNTRLNGPTSYKTLLHSTELHLYYYY